MTLTDAINILKNERPHCGRKIRYTEGDICEAFDMAIEALEQEPCYVSKLTQKAYEDGKKDGYVQAKVEQEPILEKIRAEIMQLDYNLESVDYDQNDMAMTEEVHMICREELLQIIDKYRVESEE